LHIGSQQHDLADIQISIWPAVQTPPDPRLDGIIYSGVAEAAGYTDRSDVLLLVIPYCLDPDHRIVLKQQDGVFWVVEIDFFAFKSATTIEPLSNSTSEFCI
jgi:hypothetical protein